MKAKYKDYRKASKYFKAEDDELMQNDIKNVEKQKSFIVWVQEFSKKMVVVVSILFVLLSIYELIMIYLSYKDGMLTGLETLILESNETFRIVVGGYIIKSGVENAFKIGGNYFVGVADARLNALMMQQEMKNNSCNDEDNSDNYDQDEIDYILESEEE